MLHEIFPKRSVDLDDDFGEFLRIVQEAWESKLEIAYFSNIAFKE